MQSDVDIGGKYNVGVVYTCGLTQAANLPANIGDKKSRDTVPLNCVFSCYMFLGACGFKAAPAYMQLNILNIFPRAAVSGTFVLSIYFAHGLGGAEINV